MASRSMKRRSRAAPRAADQAIAPRPDATELALASANDLLVEAYEVLATIVPPAAAVDVATQMLEDLAMYDMARSKPH